MLARKQAPQRKEPKPKRQLHAYDAPLHPFEAKAQADEAAPAPVCPLASECAQDCARCRWTIGSLAGSRMREDADGMSDRRPVEKYGLRGTIIA